MKKIKTIVVGDVHGRNNWKKWVKSTDRVIFIGDYWDSFDIPFHIQFENFLEIIDFKNKNPERVTLLLGNHDWQYLAGNKCSGYQHFFADQIRSELLPLVKSGTVIGSLLENGVLYSHAGWSPESVIYLEGERFGMVLEEMVDLFNESIKSLDTTYTKWVESDKEGYGDHPEQSPFWIRPDALEGALQRKRKVDRKNTLVNTHQVVGHTYTDSKKTEWDLSKIFSTVVIYSDIINKPIVIL